MTAMNTAWILETAPRLANAKALQDLRPIVRRLIACFGNEQLARVLGVSTETVATWRAVRQALRPEHAERILDLHDVLTRAMQVFDPSVVPDWLEGQEPFLDNKRPIDVLALEGSGPLIVALRNIDAGAYA